MNKLCLGTVQFGLNYGISNKGGKIKFKEAKKIFNLVKKSNIELIDTAISYGESEKIIGDVGITNFKFVSKLPDFPKLINGWLKKRLRINFLYGLLIHKTKISR